MTSNPESPSRGSTILHDGPAYLNPPEAPVGPSHFAAGGVSKFAGGGNPRNPGAEAKKEDARNT